MVRFFIRAAIFLATAALGLLITSLVVTGFRISPAGFITAVLVFAVAQSILAPFVANMARKYAPALLGGIGLVSTFLALLIASLFPGGLVISGVGTWALSTFIVWLVTALGGWLIPIAVLKNKASDNPR